jgi:predicted nucleotidyltransferase
VRRALQQGLLHRSGRLRGHRISADEIAYLERRWPLIQVMRQVLRTEPEIAAAVAFGSFARGDDGPSSDIDIVFLPRRARFNRLRLQERLGAAAGRPVDLLDWETMSKAPSIALAVIRDGRVLVDRIGAFDELRANREVIRRRAARLQQSQWRDIERMWSA